MCWSAITVLFALGLLASEALFSSLEVVVLALAALPTSFWEIELVSLVHLLLR
jgi:hypothetical protein